MAETCYDGLVSVTSALNARVYETFFWKSVEQKAAVTAESITFATHTLEASWGHGSNILVYGSTKSRHMAVSVRRMSPRESFQAMGATTQVRGLRVAYSVAFGVSKGTRWLKSSYRRISRFLGVQDLCSDILRELVLDLFNSLRLSSGSRGSAYTSVLRCLRHILHFTGVRCTEC